MNRVAIITLNWNGADDTRECIKSLLSQTYSEFHIIVVDNASSAKDTRTELDKLASNKVTVIYNDENLGFAGGVNTGIHYALEQDYDYVALFNNDAVADKEWLKELVDASKKHSSGITTGLLLHRDGKTIDSTGDWCSVWGLPFPRDRKKPVDEASASGFVFSGSGGASLYKTELFKNAGLFDEKFFMYYEDTDMSFRAQMYGYPVYYTNRAIAYHKQGASSDKVPGLAVEHTFKNLPLFYIKNMPTSLLISTGSRFTLAYLLMLGNAIKSGNGGPALKGWFTQIYLFWFHALPARIKIQREKRVSDTYIKSILWPDLPPDQTGLRKFRSLFLTSKK
ncbi:glycosyltransferase family 2 protein [Candidatus Saccharibacteria bacterium]|nr:glycosyltransferase family 2 protein [Candidatus Saccharibacteria bacterium]